MKIVIRTAELKDLDWLMKQLVLFSQFFGTKLSLFGEESHARAVIGDMIQNHLFYLAEADALGSVGFIAGSIGPHPFNPKIRVLSEMFWWVPEEFRGSRAGVMLLDAFIDWGKANVDWITFALETKSPVKDETILKRGFKSQERSFLMEVC